jgi:hypothetical protein
MSAHEVFQFISCPSQFRLACDEAAYRAAVEKALKESR